ncbi:hypothetical protein CC78DRAFT_580525 [Lojkania enalia]|uniref:Uncharacterized protein n=1 Tax=Lojkania enalia TaxID=147567 RepID=A0A9P4KB65_9PLEO|nr:hypothetical protein CC78DRAFT_580525 [Didymosphaeria enalia]
MKFSALITLLVASIALASPATTSLERSTKIVVDANGNELAMPCVECPCEPGWNTECTCIPNGCCCVP